MISFLIFAYNEEKFIDESINSVLCLDDDIELVLVDDHSSDNTWGIMQQYADNDSRVRACLNPKKGKNSAANYGMSCCTGDWVMILGGDDIFENKNYGEFVNKMNMFDPLSQRVFIGGLVRRFTHSQRYQAENGVLNAFPRKGEHRACTNGFASRLIIDSVYPIPEDYPNEDTWTSMYYYYFCDHIENVPLVCLNYRIHDNNSLNHNDQDFEKFSSSLHVRSNQQLDFIEHYRNQLSPEDIDYLQRQYDAENYRYNKKYIKLLLSRISFAEKMRMLLNSNKQLKNFKYTITKFAQQKK